MSSPTARRSPAHAHRRNGASLVQSTASPDVGHRLASIGLALATVIGVWIGVDAPDMSPVSPPQTAGQQAPGNDG